jgi:hypothetical protein
MKRYGFVGFGGAVITRSNAIRAHWTLDLPLVAQRMRLLKIELQAPPKTVRTGTMENLLAD